MQLTVGKHPIGSVGVSSKMQIYVRCYGMPCTIGSLGSRCLKGHGLADDVAMVVVAKHLLDAERTCNQAGNRTSAWLDPKRLALATHNTEAVLISTKKEVEPKKPQ